MKIRWRQHEMIFATMASAILLTSYLWSMYHLPADAITKRFAKPFEDNHLAFNFYRNQLIPQIAAGLVIYLTYLFVNIFTIPRLLFPKKFEAGTSKISVSLEKIAFQGIAKKIFKRYMWVFIQIGVIIFIAGTAFDIAIYYLHQWQFNYPGFSIFFNKDQIRSQLGISQGYVMISLLLVVYAIYVIIREIVISFIEKPGGKRDYMILICNQVTLVLIEYLLVPFFLISFDFISNYDSFLAYFLIVPSLLLMYMSNLYWLFPFKKERPFSDPSVFFRLFTTAILCTFPFLFFMHEKLLFGFVFGIAVQLFVITPISWLVYQRKKDELQLLRGAEKTIAKSKADLQFLRSQINPHFLFNVLNTLYGTALQENAERTASGIQKLGDMMRFMLHENHLEFIQMSNEIEYLKNYIALQKLRTQSSADISIEENISDQNCNYKIAPMLLIPFVENAFKHGISLKEKSWIKINLACSEKNILFEVRNSMHPGRNNDPEEGKSGIGFKNVLERLKLIYGGKFEISVNGDGKEFFVQLSIQP